MDTGSQRRLESDRWLDRHGDALYRYALARLGSSDAAQDMVQETLLAAWQGRSGFKGASSERTWLLGICRHKVSDYLRQSGHFAPSTAYNDLEMGMDAEFFTTAGAWRHPPDAWTPAPLDEIEAEGFWNALQACLAQLPEAQREGFVLQTLNGVEPVDVSRLLHVSMNHLYVLLHRARLRLRQCLDTHWFGGK